MAATLSAEGVLCARGEVVAVEMPERMWTAQDGPQPIDAISPES